MKSFTGALKPTAPKFHTQDRFFTTYKRSEKSAWSVEKNRDWKNLPWHPVHFKGTEYCGKEGMFVKLDRNIIGYKKTFLADQQTECITKLLIPTETIVHIPVSFVFIEHLDQDVIESKFKEVSQKNKFRAEKAVVIHHQVQNIRSLKIPKVTTSMWDGSVCYVVGTTVLPDEFSKRNFVCDNGIHFFLEKENAYDFISHL